MILNTGAGHRALVFSPADKASKILKRLSVDAELLDWREYLDVARIQRQAFLRCARYQIPSIEALVQTLN